MNKSEQDRSGNYKFLQSLLKSIVYNSGVVSIIQQSWGKKTPPGYMARLMMMKKTHLSMLSATTKSIRGQKMSSYKRCRRRKEQH